MTAPTLTLSQLKKLRPCADALERVESFMGRKRKLTASRARAAGATMRDILWAASAVSYTNPDVERRVLLWLLDCAEHVLHLHERYYPTDDRPRNAIIATRVIARDEVNYDATWISFYIANAAAWAARYAACTGVRDVEEAWQFDRLIERFSDKEPEDFPLSAKSSGTESEAMTTIGSGANRALAVFMTFDADPGPVTVNWDRDDPTRRGWARRGGARRGAVWRGAAEQGKARQSKAKQSKAKQGQGKDSMKYQPLTTVPTLTFSQLKTLQPCKDTLARIETFMGDKKMSAVEARAAGATFDDIVWVASTLAREDLDIERRVRLWLADCAAHVLRFYERNYADDRPRNVIKAARAFARGEINVAVNVAVSAAMEAANDAERDAIWAAATWSAEDVASSSASWAAAWAARAAAWAAQVAARDVRWTAGDATWSASAAANASTNVPWATTNTARDVEEAWQFDRLVMWLSGTEPEDYH